MKIYIFLLLFFSSFDPFSSSPVTKKQLDAYNCSVAKFESSMKIIMPQVENYFSKIHHQVETNFKKSATTPKSTENKELIADTYTSSNVKHLGNATENRYEDNVKKAKIGGISRDAYNDAVLKMKYSMHDYFSMMRHVLKKLEEKREEKSDFTSTSNENKEPTADAHLSSNVKNNSKHLNNMTEVLRQDDLSKIETNGSSFDTYNDVMQAVGSAVKLIMPKIADYFSNRNVIVGVQPEERDEKSVTSSKLIKIEENIGEVYTSPNGLNAMKSLNNAPNNKHEIGLSEVKPNESSFDAYNNAIVKRQASIEALMPQIDDYFLKKHHILIGQREGKSVTSSKSTEKKQHTAKADTSFNEKSLREANSDRRENEISNAKTNKKSVENQLDRDLEHHTPVELSNSIASRNWKFVMNSTERKSNKSTAINNTSNEQSSNRKSSKVNFSQKELFNSSNEDVILKKKQLHESSNKVDYQLTQENRSVLNNISSGSIRQNETSSVIDNSTNGFLKKQYSEVLETKKSGTNEESLKNIHEIEEGDIITASTKSTAEWHNPKESGGMENIISNSSEDFSKIYQIDLVQKTYPITLTSRLKGEDEMNIIGYKKSRTEKHIIKQENSGEKTSSLTSTIGHAQKYEKSFTKETGETSEKVEVPRNDKQKTKNKIMNHSTTTSKLDNSDTKS